MEVATTTASSLALHTRIKHFSPFPSGGRLTCDFSGTKVRPECLNPASISSSKDKRSAVIMVIPYTRGSAWEQPPPDLASYLFKNQIVYLGMSLVPSVTELIFAEVLYLQYEDEETPTYLYIGGGEKLGYETEAFAIYDVMGYVKPPIFTLCVGNAWGEAATSGCWVKGKLVGSTFTTIMIKQPIGRFQGQATDVDLARKEVTNVQAELVNILVKNIGKSPGQIEADISHPKYFNPGEAVEYGIIDKVTFCIGWSKVY